MFWRGVDKADGGGRKRRTMLLCLSRAHLRFLSCGSLAGLRQDRDESLRCEDKLLLGQQVSPIGGGWVGWRQGRQIVLETSPTRGLSAEYWARPAARSWDLGAGQKGVDLAGDVAFEDADDLAFGETFFASSGDIGAGSGIVAHAGDHDPP
jgi:hypothetical protein